MAQLDSKFSILPKRLQSFLISQYGEEHLLAWNYVGSSAVKGVIAPRDIDIIMLVTDRTATKLPALPEWIVGGEDYDEDYIIRYQASWLAKDALGKDTVVYWDLLVMDDRVKYTDWLIAAQLAVSMDVTDKTARKKLFSAILNIERMQSEGQQLLAYRTTKRYNELVLAGVIIPDTEKPQDWFFTFGTNSSRAKNFVRVHGTQAEAREKIVSTYGAAWAFQYSSMQTAGVEKWQLIEIPLGE